MPGGILALLAAANFVAGMGALGVVGLVGPVGLAFDRPPSEAGWMMSLYALVYAVAAPGLVSLTGGLDRARVLSVGLCLFGGGALAAGLAQGFVPLLTARATMAVGGALITPVAASIGVALSPPERRGRALALVFSGLTLAQALGEQPADRSLACAHHADQEHAAVAGRGAIDRGLFFPGILGMHAPIVARSVAPPPRMSVVDEVVMLKGELRKTPDGT
jgi:MFS family permease